MHASTEEPSTEAQIGQRNVVFDGQTVLTPVFDRKTLLAGNRIPGPSIIVEYSATTVVPPFAEGLVDQYGNLVLTIDEEVLKS